MCVRDSVSVQDNLLFFRLASDRVKPLADVAPASRVQSVVLPE